MSITKSILFQHHRQAVMLSDWRKAQFIFELLRNRKTTINGFELHRVGFFCMFGHLFGLHYRQVQGQFCFEFYY